MSEAPRRRLFGRTAEPSVTEEVPRPVRVAAAWSWRLLLIAAVVALVLWLVVMLRVIVIPVLIALLVAALLVPFVNFLHRHRWPRALAIATAFFSLIIVVGLWLIWTFLYIASLVPLIPMMEAAPPDAAPPPLFWIGMGSMIIPTFVMIVIGLYGLRGGIRTWQGKEFRYLLIGPWLERSGLWNGKNGGS